MHHPLDYNPYTGNISRDTIITPFIIIQDIRIDGNNITNEKIILREIGYKEGDSISIKIIDSKLVWIKNRIFNTTLFLWVDIDLYGDGQYKTMHITVKERFYISLLPSFGLADRNFNEWWQDRNHDFARIYYGLKLKVKNMWGLNHTMNVRAVMGFNQKVELNYTIPYVNRRQKTGMMIYSLIERNPQVAFQTFEHKLDYLESDRRGREKFDFGFLFTRRNKFYIQHQIGPYFQYTSISDTLAVLNPDYFVSGADYQRSLGLKYNLSLDKRDFIHYPLKGYLMKLEADYHYLISKDNIHISSLRSEYTQFIPLSKRLYFAASARGKLSAPSKQPYASQRGLGYNKEIVSGYERYVVDGQVYGLIKTNVRWQVFSVNPTFHVLPRRFRTIPLSMYFKIYGDAGYVADNTFNPYNNFLSNRLLTGGGAGVDIVTYYDIVGRIEYSINQLGETGLFLHIKAGI